MKYVITESQYRYLIENTVLNKIRRRANKKYFSEFIEEAVDEFLTCDEFDDAYEYATGIINRAVSNFLYDMAFSRESFEKVGEDLFETCWDWFADDLSESFYNQCPESGDDEDSISLRDLRDFD